jgi:hypothetical protein
MRPDARENSKISPSTIVRAALAAGSHPHLASVLQQGRKSANIHASSGVMRGIPVDEAQHLGDVYRTRGLAMYALIIVIGMLSQGASGSAVLPVGVTSQIVGKFKNLDECKVAASQPHAGGPISDFNLPTRGGPPLEGAVPGGPPVGFVVVTTWGANWYCTYTGAN